MSEQKKQFAKIAAQHFFGHVGDLAASNRGPGTIVPTFFTSE
jgi:hypothetical protein